MRLEHWHIPANTQRTSCPLGYLSHVFRHLSAEKRRVTAPNHYLKPFSPDSSSALGNPSKASATVTQQSAKFKASNATHRISAAAFASSACKHVPWGCASRFGPVAERDVASTQASTQERVSCRAIKRADSFIHTICLPLPVCLRHPPLIPGNSHSAEVLSEADRTIALRSLGKRFEPGHRALFRACGS